MPNNNYRRGYALERNVKKYLESIGYKATRAAGSHGLFDVWALGPDHVLLVQCKIGANELYAKKLVKEMLDDLVANRIDISVVVSVVVGMKAGKPNELARAKYGGKCKGP